MTAMPLAATARQLPPWIRPLAFSIPLVFALVACGGGGGDDTSAKNSSENSAPTDPLNIYKTQVLNWAACADSVLKVVSKVQCASFDVPKDYAAPDKGKLTIQAMRVPAMSEQRKGAIFFNPGGPGGDGLNRGLGLLSSILKQANANPQIVSLQAQLVNGYDLVGFNPRGTGSDSPLICASDADQLTVDHPSAARNRPGNFEAMSANQQAFAQACQSNPLTPYISTDATARDMDLLRHLMGDNKINYLGYSYGTWLGAWYGRLFPERVERMVLDSNTDVSSEYMDATEHQAIARDTLIDKFLAPYAARHSATYALGNTPDEVRVNLDTLEPAVKTAFTGAIGMNFYAGSTTPDSMIALVAAKGLNQLLIDLPGANLTQIRNAIDAHQFVPLASSVTNYEIRQKAHLLLKNYDYVRIQSNNLGQSKEKTYLGSDGEGGNLAVLFSITCNDALLPSRNLSDWKALGDTIAQKAPFFGGGNPLTQTCMYWTPPNIQHPPLSALQGLDILMVQSQYDSATPTPNAMKGFAALPNAHMVYVTDEYQHGVFPYNTSCVDVPVLQYLLGQSPNWRQMNCAASGIAAPLDVNNRAARSAGSAASFNASPEDQQRSELINEFKKNIARSFVH